MGIPKPTFSIALFLFQVMLLVVFACQADYNTSSATDANALFYPQFQDVHVMIFIGFGFLMTFLQKYGFSAVGYNFMIAAVSVQWALLLNSWLANAMADLDSPGKVFFNVRNLISADFTAAAILITFGAVLGKVSRLQLLVIAIIECVFYAINESILMHRLYISDVGGSIVIHTFGAYFGLTVAWIMGNADTREENEKEGSNYHSDIFSMIGTIFLWIYWPSFNGAMLGDRPQQQNRAFLNTYIALAACVVMTFVISPLVNKSSRLSMVHVQNATLAAGVAIGACADLNLNLWGAILMGMIAGVISTLGFAYLTPFLNKNLGLHDTCGVHNLHGMPGIMSGVCSAIAAASIKDDEYTNVVSSGLRDLYVKRGEWSRSKQAGFQMAGLCVSFALAVGGGIVAGLAAKWLDQPKKNELFDDDEFWKVPQLPTVAHYEMSNSAHEKTTTYANSAAIESKANFN